MKVEVVLLIPDKIDFKSKIVTRDKAGYYIMRKVSIQEDDIMIINIYTPEVRIPKYRKQVLTELKG